MRIRIRIARHLRDRVQRPFRRRVVAQHPVTLAHLLERTDSVSLAGRPMPHFLTLYEQRIPMIVVRVGTEDPVMSVRGRKRHRIFETGLYTSPAEKRNKM